jgi:hypothetical protein
MTTASAELLACPFCGGQADGPYLTGVADGAGEFYSIDCVERGCSATITERGDAATIAAWNTRAVPPAANGGAVRQFVDAVEQLAFEMPAPNGYTPRFVQICAGMQASLAAHPAPAADAEVEALIEKVRHGGRTNPMYVGTWKDVEEARALLRRLAAERATPPVASNCAAVAAEREAERCDCFGDTGLHASTHVPLGSEQPHCDLCGKPVKDGATDVLTAINSAAEREAAPPVPLLPCRCCSGFPSGRKLDGLGAGKYRYMCAQGVLCEASTPWFESECEAAASWNAMQVRARSAAPALICAAPELLDVVRRLLVAADGTHETDLMPDIVKAAEAAFIRATTPKP